MIRNLSDGPYTDRSLTTDRDFDWTGYSKTYTSKMATAVHTVNSVISEVETGSPYSTMNASLLPIYQEYYEDDPIY